MVIFIFIFFFSFIHYCISLVTRSKELTVHTMQNLPPAFLARLQRGTFQSTPPPKAAELLKNPPAGPTPTLADAVEQLKLPSVKAQLASALDFAEDALAERSSRSLLAAAKLTLEEVAATHLFLHVREAQGIPCFLSLCTLSSLSLSYSLSHTLSPSFSISSVSLSLLSSPSLPLSFFLSLFFYLFPSRTAHIPPLLVAFRTKICGPCTHELRRRATRRMSMLWSPTVGYCSAL